MAMSVKSLGLIVVLLIADAAAQNVEVPPPPPQIEATPQIQPMPRIEQLPSVPMLQPIPSLQEMSRPQPERSGRPTRATPPYSGGSSGCSVANPCEEPERPHPHEQDLDKCREYARSHGYSDSYCGGSNSSAGAEVTTRVGYTGGAPETTQQRQDDKPESSFRSYVIGGLIILGLIALFRRRAA